LTSDVIIVFSAPLADSVTRVGEFLPNGRLFSLGSFGENAEEA
jgi:hypothetical protein